MGIFTDCPRCESPRVEAALRLAKASSAWFNMETKRVPSPESDELEAALAAYRAASEERAS